jgi:pheromone shutdown-related protein TraB
MSETLERREPVALGGGGSVTLIGTAHISQESVREAESFVREETPDMVCVEIDGARYEAMEGGDSWKKLDMIKTIREGKGFLLIANLVLSSFQRRLGAEIGIRPGDEMKAAVKAAQAAGIPYAFCDRQVQITLRRAWIKCGFWSKCKLLSALFSSAFSSEKPDEAEIENLKKDSELDGMMKELSAFLPEVKETLIDERDYYLAVKIFEACREKKKAVAILGAGHITGVRAHLERFAAEDAKKRGGECAAAARELSKLDAIPPPGLFSRISGWLIPALIVAFVAAGLLNADFERVRSGLMHWILWNGSLAALGAACALAHPLAILVSFIGAPIGTLSPFVSVGLFSGIAQAYLRRPQVQDAETLPDDVTSLKGVYQNRITRILLVFFLASLGGMAGNIVSLASLARLIAPPAL